MSVHSRMTSCERSKAPAAYCAVTTLLFALLATLSTAAPHPLSRVTVDDKSTVPSCGNNDPREAPAWVTCASCLTGAEKCPPGCCFQRVALQHSLLCQVGGCCFRVYSAGSKIRIAESSAETAKGGSGASCTGVLKASGGKCGTRCAALFAGSGYTPGGRSTAIEDCKKGIVGIPKPSSPFASSARCVVKKKGGKGKLSTGAVVGIAIAGGIGALAVFAVLGVLCLRRKRKRNGLVAGEEKTKGGESEELQLQATDVEGNHQKKLQLFLGVTPPPGEDPYFDRSRTASPPPPDVHVGPEAGTFLEQSKAPATDYPMYNTSEGTLQSSSESKTTGSRIGDSSG